MSRAGWRYCMDDRCGRPGWCRRFGTCRTHRRHSLLACKGNSPLRRRIPRELVQTGLLEGTGWRFEGAAPVGVRHSWMSTLPLPNGTGCLQQSLLQQPMKSLQISEGGLICVRDALQQIVELSEQGALAGGNHLQFELLDFLRKADRI